MDLTRLSTKALSTAVEKAAQKLSEAEALLGPVLADLSDQERAGLLRPRDAFPGAARQLARLVEKHPQIATSVGFSAEAVVEDLDNVEVIAPLALRLSALHQRVADSRLLWLAEAAQPTLAAYAVAKVAAKSDPSIAPLVEALAPVLASHRAKKPAGPAQG